MSDKYEALRKAAQAATPGPWFLDRKNLIGPKSKEDDQSYGMVIAVAELSNGRIDDALYIALANPFAVLHLLAERDELAAQVEALKVDAEKPAFFRKKAMDMTDAEFGAYIKRVYAIDAARKEQQP